MTGLLTALSNAKLFEWMGIHRAANPKVMVDNAMVQLGLYDSPLPARMDVNGVEYNTYLEQEKKPASAQSLKDFMSTGIRGKPFAYAMHRVNEKLGVIPLRADVAARLAERNAGEGPPAR